jgi:hypothetical protein
MVQRLVVKLICTLCSQLIRILCFKLSINSLVVVYFDAKLVSVFIV